MLDLYATLGPSCCKRDTLLKMFENGMTGARINLSHSSLEQCRQWIDNMRKAAEQAGIAPKLIIDLQGPELRTGEIKHKLELSRGQRISIDGTKLPLPVEVIEALTAGEELALDDGRVLIRMETRSTGIVARGGVLQGRKNIAMKNTRPSVASLTEMDIENIRQAPDFGVTGVMLPFVSSGEELKNLRMELERAGAGFVDIYAKIENERGARALPDILPEADCIVIARGDLGSGMPLWQLPRVQKEIAQTCMSYAKPFMVVTQLLHSMEEREVPTRAEVNDIFNSVLDGASSLMLTGETAVGKHPQAAMEYLKKTADQAILYMAEDGI